MTSVDCVYFGQPHGPVRAADGSHWELEFECRHPEILRTTTDRCSVCPRSQAFGDGSPPPPAVAAKPKAALLDKYGHPSGLEDAWHNGHVFLLLGGPSLKTLDLDRLNGRGIVTFGVNQVAAMFRTTLWTYGDTSSKFHEAIWRDPAITKLVPFPKLGNPLRHHREDGQFELLTESPFDMPNVFGMRRNSTFRPKTWLWEDSINWGHGKAGVEADEREGRPPRPKVLNTMIQAVRLCYYLGFRHVYLCGCDFRMSEGNYYAFAETKHHGAIRSNRGSYNKVANMFYELRPEFEAAGFEVLNCNPRSALWAFDHISFDNALRRATSRMPKKIETAGWYGRGVIEENEDDGTKSDSQPG